MNTPQRNRYLGGGLLLCLFWGGACTGVPLSPAQLQYTAKTTEVDLAHGRSESTSYYHRPRGARHYYYDKTEVDLAMPRSRHPTDVRRTLQAPAALPEADTPPEEPRS